jgi:transposase
LPKIDHGIVIVEVFCREQQQSGLMLHRSRQLLVCQRTMLSNAIRGHLAELGIIAAKGRNGTAELLKIIADEQDDRIPAAARFSLDVLARQYAAKSSGQSGAVHT